MSENINPVLFIESVVPIAFSFILIFYWRAKRSFRWTILFLALMAYALAIIIKYVIQIFTISTVESYFGYVSPGTGLYFGLQTSFLEVGLAYLFAVYAFRRKALVESDAEAYGLSLSFWENGILLGALSFVSLLSDYLIIGAGGGLGNLVRTELMNANPAYFAQTGVLLPSIGYSILERVSSLLGHFSWGYLTVIAAVRKKPVYFLVALPMGLMDALVPFAGRLGISTFELVVFSLSVLFLAIALIIGRREHVKSKPEVRKADSQ